MNNRRRIAKAIWFAPIISPAKVKGPATYAPIGRLTFRFSKRTVSRKTHTRPSDIGSTTLY